MRRQRADVRHRRWCDGGRRRRGTRWHKRGTVGDAAARAATPGSGGATASGGAGGDAGSGGASAGGGGTGGGAAGGGGAGRGGASGATGTGGSAAGGSGTGGTGGALPTNIAFVTSTRVTAELGGVAGADTICQMHAQNAGLPGTYRAWLASSAGSAPSRLGAARGWRRPDGLPIADTAASLLGDPRLFYVLTVNERGARTYANYVWTGTRADGSASGDTCGDWTSGAEGLWGATGNGNLASIAWTAGGRNESRRPSPSTASASTMRTRSPAPARPNPSRVVFTSRPFTLTSAGIAAADAACTAEAAAANLPGTYRALLSPIDDAANTASTHRRWPVGARRRRGPLRHPAGIDDPVAARGSERDQRRNLPHGRLRLDWYDEPGGHGFQYVQLQRLRLDEQHRLIALRNRPRQQ